MEKGPVSIGITVEWRKLIQLIKKVASEVFRKKKKLTHKELQHEAEYNLNGNKHYTKNR